MIGTIRDIPGRIPFISMDHRSRQQVRRFIGAWTRTRDRVPVATLHAAALARFAGDDAFLRAFLPNALARDPATARALLSEPLRRVLLDELQEMRTRPACRFQLEGTEVVHKPEWSEPTGR
jgi:hypothetical protein